MAPLAQAARAAVRWKLTDGSRCRYCASIGSTASGKCSGGRTWQARSSDMRGEGAVNTAHIINDETEYSTSQIALYFNDRPFGISNRPPKTREFRVFTQPRSIARSEERRVGKECRTR